MTAYIATICKIERLVFNILYLIMLSQLSLASRSATKQNSTIKISRGRIRECKINVNWNYTRGTKKKVFYSTENLKVIWRVFRIESFKWYIYICLFLLIRLNLNTLYKVNNKSRKLVKFLSDHIIQLDCSKW